MPRERVLLAMVATCLLVVAGPALLAPSTSFIGTEYLDAHGTLWFFWWTAQQWAGDAADAALFYPWGKDVFAHTGGNLLDAALSWPLRASLGPVLGYNAWVVLLLAGNGLAGGAIARALGAPRTGQALGAMLVIAQPYALYELQLGRPTQAMLVFPGLWLAWLLRPARRPWMGALWLALSGLGYWYYGLLGAGVGALALVGLAVRRQWADVGRVALALGLGGALVSPFVWPMLGALGDGQVPGLLQLADTAGPLGRLRLQTMEGDGQGLFVVALDGRVGALIDYDGLRFDAGVRQVSPVWLFGLVAMGARLRTRSVAPLAWLFALLLVAIGPALVAGERFFANPAYLLAVEHSDILRRWWWPGRALGFVFLLIGGGVGASLPVRVRWRALAAVGLVVAAFAVGPAAQDFLPLSRWSARTSPGLDCLAVAPPGAVVELPYTLGQRPLYHQTVHEKPMMNGMLITRDAFAPPELVRLRLDNSFARRLIELGNRRYQRGTPIEAADRQALLDLGYRYAIFRKEGYQRPRPGRDGEMSEMQSDWDRARRVFSTELGEPAWEDDELAIYTLDSAPFSCP